MQDIVIVSAVRTAVGKIGGTLKDVQPDDLGKIVIEAAIKNAQIETSCIDEVILGHVKQSADAPNIARVSALKAGIPIDVPAYTVMRQCASGLQAVNNAAQAIMCGVSEIIVAGGVESMSNAPFYFRNARYGFGSGNAVVYDSNIESQIHAQPMEVYGQLNMGLTAENLAKKYGISREEQDIFALGSQEKAAKAINEGKFRDEIVPVSVPRKKAEPIVFDTDEFPRKTSMEQLTKLRPAFKDGGTVTAGNSSGRNDGASCLVLMSAKEAQKRNLKPLAILRSQAAVGAPPEIMGIGPVEATKKALKLAGLNLGDIGLIELNEAFAAQSIAVIKELNLNTEILNVNGGAIALGHALGSSGARIMATLIHEMKRRKVKYGLATLCVGGGMGVADIIELV
ncbi:Acetyl-CoA acetyltransferase [Sporomusa silvacetica DSM 10669]|uniref:acetyl-CoA C-acetyltransferase n=1 Tax=Sporomusa silvacetica DSM 10669 TaxID=1123289 RepID=A0ABZ3ITW5_9FIRM|nr:acetyl-CoA C-acetyltransferase [Sporomusa silvacetica]OZC22320.1 acetyl-CoA acetyltransferase [Sporomusa silvacetica DSM 10669]